MLKPDNPQVRKNSPGYQQRHPLHPPLVVKQLLGLQLAVAGVEDHQHLLQHALAGVALHHDSLLLPLLAVAECLLAAVVAAAACFVVQAAECALTAGLVAVELLFSNRQNTRRLKVHVAKGCMYKATGIAYEMVV